MYSKLDNFFRLLPLTFLTDVRPSPRVNGLFSGLVSRVLQFPLLHTDTGVHFLLGRIRSACARGESALEYAWAKRIVLAENPIQELKAFPYFKNYECLTEREWQFAQRHMSDVRHVVFLGSGPLPLTGLLLAQRHGCKVTLVDSDLGAVEVSRRLIEALGISSVRVVHASAESFTDFESADVVYVAALVGHSHKNELCVYRHLSENLNADTSLLVRSAHSSRKVLYRPVSCDIDTYFDRCAELYPHDDVVNSTILLRPYA